MLNILKKIWATIFYISTLSTSYVLFLSASPILTYGSIAIAILLLSFKIRLVFSNKTVKKTPILFTYFIFLMLYQLTFGLFHETDKSWLYFFSKSVICLMLALSISSNPKLYKDFFLDYTSVITAALVLIGFIFYRGGMGGRYSLGFGNPNGLGAVSAIAAGALIIHSRLPKKIRIFSILICSIGALLSGSRVAVGMLVLSLIMKHGINFRLISSLGAVLLALLVIPMFLNVQTVGLERFTQTVAEMDFSSNRELERQATLLMINESPITGNGLYAQQSSAAKEISELGSHCGYLDIIKMMGIPMGSCLILSIIFQAYRAFMRFFFSKELEPKTHLFVVISVLCATFFEAYIWGVFQVTTTIFFISFSTLQLTYHEQHRRAI